MRLSILVACAAFGITASSSIAALDPNDPSIINLYQFNEATSGDLANGTPGAFLDTAPTGTPQDHDDLGAAPPTWTSGLPVGDGIGLTFNRSETDFTRFKAWMTLAQGNYTNGQSFSVMARVNAASFTDGSTYDVVGIGSHRITFIGSGTPNAASVQVNVRDQDNHFTLDSFGTTTGTSSSGTTFLASSGNWYNVFLIYSANSTLTVAMDDGTTFLSQTATGVPSGFDSIAEGFDNATVPWFVGSLGSAVNTFDGTIESIVIWDKALTNAEADAINLTTVVPEPATASMLVLGGLAALARRRRA